MKKRCAILSRMIALLIALLLLLVPMVAHTSEGDAWAGSGSGLQGMQTEPGIVPFNGDPPSFVIGAPEYEGGELTWGNSATIHLCNDGCNVEGSCCYYNSCAAGCLLCIEHRGRQKYVYLGGTATGPVTWEIICYGVFDRDEIEISFVPGVGGGYDRLDIGVHDGVTICRDRIIILAVTRDGVTVTVTIHLRACCLPCLLFCLDCEGCFNCTVDPCPCTSGWCVNCCPYCPEIFKSASPTMVRPGEDVVYTIRVTRGDLDCEGFYNIRVIDHLDPYLEFVTSSIQVDGVNGFEYDVVNNVITISNMEMISSEVEYVVITFTVSVCEDVTLEVIPNTAKLFFSDEDDPRRTARAEIEVIGVKNIEIEKRWEGIPTPILEGINYIVVELVKVEGERLTPLVPPITEKIEPDDDGNWFGTIVRVPVNDAQGNPIVYTIREIAIDYDGDGAFLPPRVVRIPGQEGGPLRIIITNIYAEYEPYEAAVVSFQVTKVWQGDEDYLDERPEYVTIELRRPNQLAPVRPSIRLSEVNNWTHTWTGLEATSNGVPIEYYVIEVEEFEHYYVIYQPGRIGQNFITLVINTRQIDDVEDERREDRRRRGPLTGDFAADGPLFASLLFAMSAVFGGASLKKRIKEK